MVNLLIKDLKHIIGLNNCDNEFAVFSEIFSKNIH